MLLITFPPPPSQIPCVSPGWSSSLWKPCPQHCMYAVFHPPLPSTTQECCCTRPRKLCASVFGLLQLRVVEMDRRGLYFPRAPAGVCSGVTWSLVRMFCAAEGASSASNGMGKEQPGLFPDRCICDLHREPLAGSWRYVLVLRYLMHTVKHPMLHKILDLLVS